MVVPNYSGKQIQNFPGKDNPEFFWKNASDI